MIERAGWTRLVAAAAVALLAMGPGGRIGVARAGGPQSGEIVLDKVPIPHQVHSRSAPAGKTLSRLVPFDTAPFPYRGAIPKADQPFLDVNFEGRRGHRTGRGQVLWEDETFNDRRVLLAIPAGFDIRRPSLMIVFYHGHGATLGDDVFQRQQVPAQLAIAGANAVLIAPQLAVNAADSSIGKLWQPGGFARFLGEAARELANLHGDPRSARSFATMPIVIVAYSGGYVAAAWSVHHGGIRSRLRGVVLLDALYGEMDKFADWIAADRSRIFISAYTGSTRSRNRELQQILSDRAIEFTTSTGRNSKFANVAFLQAASDTGHRDFVNHAWVANPLADFLARLNGYSQRQGER